MEINPRFRSILEHVGDIIDKNLMELAAKKIKRKVVFSKEGARLSWSPSIRKSSTI